MTRWILAIAIALTPSSVPAQTPARTSSPGAGDTHLDFSGTWAIDRSISNDPQQVTLDGTQASRDQRNGGFGSYRRGGSRGGRPDNRQPAASSMTPDERARLQALVDALKTSSNVLVISHHEPDFVVSDAKNQTQFLKTDGSTSENHLGSVTVSSTTRWDGSRLVTTYPLGGSDQLVYTYTLLSATKQLVLRVRHDAAEGQRGGSPELKLVYTLEPGKN
jgi:hypothetical protein